MKRAQVNKVLFAVIIGLIILLVVLIIFSKARVQGNSAIDAISGALW